MAIARELALAEGVTAEADEAAVVLRGRFGVLALRRPTPGMRAALAALAGGATDAALAELAGPDAVRLFYHLESQPGSALALGLLAITLRSGGAPLLTIAPAVRGFALRPTAIDDATEYRLSRFALCRRDGERFVIESPLSPAAVRVHDARVVALVFALARATRPPALAAAVPGLDPPAARAVLRALGEAALLEPDADDAARGAALRQWELHDLHFHHRTRAPHAGRVGGTYRFAGEIAPLPAIKPPMSDDGVDLARPDMAALVRSDPPLAEVMERRRSLRAARAPLSAAQLGELLYRAARVRALRPSEHAELSDRPYPGAGALYPLEIYPLVHACDGLAPGLFHYCPLRHRLERLAGMTPDLAALVDEARAAAVAPEPPGVLLVLAARFQRIAWKYETSAYELLLKDLGGLMQTLYLAATAMSLAPCAIGRGDADRFGRAAGIDAWIEAAIGEFALFGAL